jgi:hypothetical protein
MALVWPEGQEDGVGIDKAEFVFVTPRAATTIDPFGFIVYWVTPELETGDP